MAKSILLVDDNYLCVEGIHQSIQWEALGITGVTCVYDGQTALEYIQSHPVDLVISDISMPGLSGLELSEKILALHSSIKIILISAYDKFEYAKKAVRLGAFDYIEKPLDYDYLTEILKKAIEELDQEKENLEILKKSRPAMEEQFYRSLISSDLHDQPETLSLYARYLDIRPDCRYWITLCISTEDTVSLKQKLGIEEFHVRLMNLENDIRKASESFCMHYLLRDLTGFTCILGTDTQSYDEFKKEVTVAFSEIAERYHDRFELAVALGKIVSNIHEISASYTQAQKALEYRFFFPSQNILEAANISGSEVDLLLGRDGEEEELIQLLCKNDRDGIKNWIQDFAGSFTGNCDSRNLVYTRLYSIVARILKFTYEMNLSNERLQSEAASFFSHPEAFQTINKVADWLYEICEQLCSSLQNSVASYHQSLCERAASYIAQNYQNSELDLNEIAEYVQITPAYLSSLFKKCRDQNISNFITDVRIDAACQLLKNTALSLKVISTQVGYSNQYYFSACFKKKTGMTPSAYREQLS